MAKSAPKRKAANGYKFAEPLPKGEILEDVAKKKWKLGPSIGQGGFGEIYSAQEAESGGSKYPYVIKIEPHGNGPLFVEMHFYMRNAKPEDVEKFKKQRGLKTFGMPVYLGAGSHEYKGEKYRFIVMEKFGTDLWKLFIEHNRTFPTSTVFKVAIQILDVLQYIHERGYVHADIKAANILMGTTKDTLNKQIYVVDFGLATKYCTETEFKPNPKKAHDGTIEYLSRDAHKGVQTIRGDLEILAYNIIQWLGCVLPWEKNLKDPNVVHSLKNEHMASVPKFIKACFEKRSPPGPVVDFLNYILTLDHNSVPDYKTIRKIFLSGLDPKDALGKPLQFSPITRTPIKRKAEVKKKTSPKRKPARKKKVEEPSEDEKENVDDDEHEEPMQIDEQEENPASDNEEPVKSPTRKRGRKAQVKKKPSPKRKPGRRKTAKEPSEDEKDIMEDDEDDERDEPMETEKEEETPALEDETPALEDETPALEDETPALEDEEPTRSPTRRRSRNNVNYKEDSDDERKRVTKSKTTKKKQIRKVTSPEDLHVTGDSMDGYTDEMKDILKRKQQNGKSKGSKKKTVPVQEENEDFDDVEDSSMKGYTQSMKDIAQKRANSTTKRGKKADLVPVATSSKAEDKKGLVRLGKNKKVTSEPVHTDLGGHESDSE